jgi:GNAT superfamily N-acetyltransferase
MIRDRGGEITLSKLEARHLDGALKLSQEFSWPYRLEDWEFAASVGEGVVLEGGGEVLGTALWWCYGKNHAAAGMIIVTAKAQGGGNGSRLFDALLDATEGRNVLLNSTEQGLPLYGRRGFEPWGRVLQHQGPLTSVPEIEPCADIRPAVADDVQFLQEYDERAIGMPRQSLVAALANVGETVVLVRGGRVAGYSISRKFGRGYVVGPVAADSAEDAKRLISAQLARLCGQFVRIDVYADDGLSDWLQGLGLTLVGDAVSMVKGTKPAAGSPARPYAVANQSFG